MNLQKSILALLRGVLVFLTIVGLAAIILFFRQAAKKEMVIAVPIETVIVGDRKIVPAEVRVAFGDVVTWRNSGLRPHTITFPTFTKVLLPEENWSLRINLEFFQAGENIYRDDYSGNQAKLFVEK